MTQLSDVDRFIEVTQAARTPADLNAAMAGITREMGFDYFALIHHVDLRPMNARLTHMMDGSLVALTDYPEHWVEAYVSRDIVANDPILLASHQTTVGFEWADIPKLIRFTPAHRRICEETLAAGIGEGFTIPAHVPGEPNGSCNFAMRSGRRLPETRLRMAQLVGSFAFQAARGMVLKARGRSLPQPVKLSPRELDCLTLVARGKTDWEIGRILGISEETAKFYIKKARERYDVPTRIQAAIRSIFDGQIPLKDIFH